MTKLKRVSVKIAVRALGKLGFKKVRQRGSHVILKKLTSHGTTGCVVPDHKELAIGTLRSILRQAKVTPEEFMKAL